MDYVCRQCGALNHASGLAQPDGRPAQLAPGAVAPRPRGQRPPKAAVKRFEIRHRTSYRYARRVEHSTHLFRLRPIHDDLQAVLRSGLSVSVEGHARDYEDMFGNHTRRYVVDTPYSEMTIVATSTTEVYDVDPLSFEPLRDHQVPVAWMPWHRQVLQPFLLPPELAESELEELIRYGMSFSARNDRDILATLMDINETIHREYAYSQGVTTLATTPFDVYASRRGVCQDFTNLFICLARLLGVPARYVCGYLDTGPTDPNRAQGNASHAWAQVYLPEVGWRGFDPTNGVVTQTDHVRVAVGRNYRDATPTSGTFYGGGAETLEVDVRVERVQ